MGSRAIGTRWISLAGQPVLDVPLEVATSFDPAIYHPHRPCLLGALRKTLLQRLVRSSWKGAGKT